MTDIVERLRFDAARCELQFSKGVAGNIEEAADEIERLRTDLMIAGERFAEAMDESERLRALNDELRVQLEQANDPIWGKQTL